MSRLFVALKDRRLFCSLFLDFFSNKPISLIVNLSLSISTLYRSRMLFLLKLLFFNLAQAHLTSYGVIALILCLLCFKVFRLAIILAYLRILTLINQVVQIRLRDQAKVTNQVMVNMPIRLYYMLTQLLTYAQPLLESL